MPVAPINNRYASMNFPEYVYREYPKAVTHNGKNYVVNDADEEKALKATVRDYHKEAMQRAAELKLEIPADWKLEKIQLYIKKMESDLEFERLMKEEAMPSGDKDATKTSMQNKLTLNRNLNK